MPVCKAPLRDMKFRLNEVFFFPMLSQVIRQWINVRLLKHIITCRYRSC